MAKISETELQKRLKKLESYHAATGALVRRVGDQYEYVDDFIYTAYASALTNLSSAGKITNQSDATGFQFSPYNLSGTLLPYVGFFVNKSIYQSGDPTDYTWESTSGQSGFTSSERYYTTSTGLVADLGNPIEPGTNITWTEISSGNAIPSNAVWYAERFTISGVTGKWIITPVDAYIDSGQLVDASVIADKIAANAVTTAKILDDAIDADKIANNAVTVNAILDGAISTDKIASNAVTTAKILNDAINADKIANNAVTTAAILDDAIDSDKIAANAVTTTEIAANTIVANNIQANAIGANEISANSITAAEIAANAITATEIAANAIGANQIAANSITAAEIATNAITADEVQAGAIGASEIAANSITAAEIAALAVTATEIQAGAIGTDKLAANAVTADKIGANEITATEMAAGSITATEIAADAVTANKIATNAVTADAVAAGTITATKIASDAITTDKINVDSEILISNNAGRIRSGDIGAGSTAGTFPATSGDITGSGFLIGNDTSDSGTAKFLFGNSTQAIYWDGSTLSLLGKFITDSNIASIDGSSVSTQTFEIGSQVAISDWNSNHSGYYIYKTHISSAEVGRALYFTVDGDSNPVIYINGATPGTNDLMYRNPDTEAYTGTDDFYSDYSTSDFYGIPISDYSFSSQGNFFVPQAAGPLWVRFSTNSNITYQIYANGMKEYHTVEMFTVSNGISTAVTSKTLTLDNTFESIENIQLTARAAEDNPSAGSTHYASNVTTGSSSSINFNQTTADIIEFDVVVVGY